MKKKLPPLFPNGYSLRNEKEIASSFPEKESYPLTEEGKKESLESAKKLKEKNISLIISSDLQRTKETAEIISREIGAEIKFDERIRELDAGDFNGQAVKKIKEYLEGKNLFDIEVPGGESYRDVKKRVYSFLKDINKKYKNQNILIISHGAPLLLMAFSVTGEPDEKLGEFKENNSFETAQIKKIEFKNLPYDKEMKIDPHRPFIDEVEFYCPKCNSLMKRVPEVIDCWFDAGSMPFAQFHFPFEEKETKKNEKGNLQPRLFPADYICEGVDQTRGWFYTLLAISTLLEFGTSYKNVISLGHILDEKGNKMSKSKGNIVDPLELIKKYGCDALRWYFFTVNKAGDQKLFKEKDVEDCLKRFIMTLWNCFVFLQTYKKEKDINFKTFNSSNLLDKWIISKLNRLIEESSGLLEKYEIVPAARMIESFVVENFSQWYIRRSRKRLQKPQNEKEFKEASETIAYVLLSLSKLSAPFIPFLPEEIYKGVGGNKESIHLEDWPKADPSLIDQKLDEEMEEAREIVRLALSERSSAGIKVRQPLSSLTIKSSALKEDIVELIKEEVNVKNVSFDDSIEEKVKLDTLISDELKKEGLLREVVRSIQVMRKKAKLKPEDKISVGYEGGEMNKILEESKEFILKESKAQSFEKKKDSFDLENEFVIGNEKLWLGIRKV